MQKRKCRFPVMDWLDASRKKRKSVLSWLWEFTKKVVSIVTVIYIVISLYPLLICYVSLNTEKDIVSVLNILIQETNETFRVVVGGYLLKACVENTFKIINKSNKLEDMEDEEN